VVLGWSEFGRAGDVRILLIAGVHGSERSAVEVGEIAAGLLRGRGDGQAWVRLVPVMFWDAYRAAVYAARQRRGSDPPGGPEPASPVGRRVWRGGHRGTDPNRNFPSPGACWHGSSGLDATGQPLLAENVALMDLVCGWGPTRIVSLHAVQQEPDRGSGSGNPPGIFVDPSTTLPLDRTREAPDRHPRRSASDRLAIEAAAVVHALSADGDGIGPSWVRGNLRGGRVRNTRYPRMGHQPTDGVSLGEWASRPVRSRACRAHARAGVPVFTVEVGGYHRSDEEQPAGADPAADRSTQRRQELTAYARAVVSVLCR
jgi:hypothetical protein